MKENTVRNNRIQRIISVLMIAILVVLLNDVSVFAAQTAQSEKSTQNAYKKAYLNLINRRYDLDNFTYEDGTRNSARYKLIYIDSDNIPELIINQNDQVLRLYTWKNGKVHKLSYIIYMMDAQLDYWYKPGKNRICSLSISDYSYEHPGRPTYINEEYYTMNASHTKLVPTGQKRTYRKGKQSANLKGYKRMYCIKITNHGDVKTGKTYKKMVKALSK